MWLFAVAFFKDFIVGELIRVLLIIIAVAAIICILFWLILLPYNMAKERGRSGGFWLFVGVFINPLVAIGLLALLGDAECDDD